MTFHVGFGERKLRLRFLIFWNHAMTQFTAKRIHQMGREKVFTNITHGCTLSRVIFVSDLFFRRYALSRIRSQSSVTYFTGLHKVFSRAVHDQPYSIHKRQLITQ